jgi:hypothetical protein
MGRFVVGADRSQLIFLPECLDDWVGEDNPVHVIEAFVEVVSERSPGQIHGLRSGLTPMPPLPLGTA